jgi:hypothetical protein
LGKTLRKWLEHERPEKYVSAQEAEPAFREWPPERQRDLRSAALTLTATRRARQKTARENPSNHPTALFFILLIVLLVVVEIGQLLSMRLSVDSDQWQLVAARDSVGLLLSLLLGFTLAMAISRHDQ